MSRNNVEYERDTSSRQGYFRSLLGVYVGYGQRALVDESEMFRTQIGTHNRSETVAVLGTPVERLLNNCQAQYSV
jgi:hypothetical protein